MKTVKTAVKSKSTSKKVVVPTATQAIAPSFVPNLSTTRDIVKTDKEIQEAIRLKAHELYLQRNGAAGDGLEDWLAAERIVLSNSSSNVAQKK